jgi:hypothetical protein
LTFGSRVSDTFKIDKDLVKVEYTLSTVYAVDRFSIFTVQNLAKLTINSASKLKDNFEIAVGGYKKKEINESDDLYSLFISDLNLELLGIKDGYFAVNDVPSTYSYDELYHVHKFNKNGYYIDNELVLDIEDIFGVDELAIILDTMAGNIEIYNNVSVNRVVINSTKDFKFLTSGVCVDSDNLVYYNNDDTEQIFEIKVIR